MVSALASDKYARVRVRPGVICGLSLLRGLFSGLSGFSPSTKTKISPNSNSARIEEPHENQLRFIDVAFTLNIVIYNPSNLFTRARLAYTRHVTEYSPAKTVEYPRIFPNFENCARCEKDLKDNKDNSLHLERKYARIFVLGHYLFLVAHSFPRATLSENCSLLGTDNVRGQIS